MRRLAVLLVGLVAAVGIDFGQPLGAASQGCTASATTICINGNDDTAQQNAGDRNRTYEGAVGESAGAEARLLFDYPQTQRDAILDMLFCNTGVTAASGYCTNSYYGASLSGLKVEVGGDSNSTQGSEASFARTSTEFNALHQDFDVSGTEAQQQADCHLTRGYEWWLMREATRRNPSIPILALVWNAPNYLQRTTTPYADNSFYSDQTQSNGNSIDYYRYFIRCAAVNKIYDNGTSGDDPALSNGTKIAWVGAWNETDYRDWTNPTPTWTHVDWVNRLGTMAHGQSPAVKAVCCDYAAAWDPASSDLQNAVFGSNIDAVAAHDQTFGGTAAPSALQTYTGGSTHQASIWEGEDCFCIADENPQPQNDWTFAGLYAKWINRNYIQSRVSLTSMVPMISSFYEYLYSPNAGITTADTPWSGNYQVWEAIWAVAHTTQFVVPGQWTYINSASCFLGQVQGTNCRTALSKGSYVTFKGPGATKDWATVVETIDGSSTRSLTLCPTTSNLKSPSNIWYVVSNSTGQFIGSASQYINKDANGCYPFGNNLAANSVYTFYTLNTPYKGVFSPSCSTNCTFPYHYMEDFDEPTPGDTSTTSQCARATNYLNSAYAMNATPCWISTEEGNFEITPSCGAPNGGNCLQQTLTATPIPTCGPTTPNPPCTPPTSDLYWAVVGDPTALPSNYHWRVQFKILDSGGSVDLFGHVTKATCSTCWEAAPDGYRFELNAGGAWTLYRDDCNYHGCFPAVWTALTNGTLACFHSGGTCDSTIWNTLDITFSTHSVAGDTISVTLIDRNCTSHAIVSNYTDGTYDSGAVGLGSNTSRVAFDQLELGAASDLFTCGPY